MDKISFPLGQSRENADDDDLKKLMFVLIRARMLCTMLAMGCSARFGAFKTKWPALIYDAEVLARWLERLRTFAWLELKPRASSAW